ncbi:MAG TPA: hypothetical protein ENK57_11935 [Polyangiaceae bacterium]|nr:hypothetical protein [Polyangiaceae bacterium]
MRELGVDPEQARKDAEELAAMKAAEEKRRAAEMSELEKAQAEAEKAKAAALEAEQKAAIAAKDAETARLAAAHRVPDLEYLAFRLQKCPADADPHEWLGKLLEDETERVRFGVSDGAPAGGSGDGGGEKKKPTTTTTPKTGGAPTPTKTGGGGGDGGGEKTAMQMTRAEYEAHKRKKYGSGGQGVRKGYKPPPR